MLIESLSIDDRIKKIIVEEDGIRELYPPQVEAIEQGLLEGKNLVISIPTAAGKTLLAELAALKHVLEQAGKAIYLCPLRALAAEKYKDFKRFESLGVKVAITSGDYDSSDYYLPRYDIIISTNEKFDALLRHGVSWIDEEVTLVIVDECHLLNDQHRGPTLEILLARLLMKNTKLQLIALSATIGNSDDLSEWLGAELVQSEWRPVPLKEGIYCDDHVIYSDYSTRDIPYKRKDLLLNIALDSYQSQEQVLIFVPSRRSAVATAQKIGAEIDQLIGPREKKELTKIANSLTTNIADPLSKQLMEIIKSGSAFHHAGLNSDQRAIVESSFKTGAIKILCATPTLCLSKETKVWQGHIQSEIKNFDRSKPVFALSGNRLIPVQSDYITQLNNYQPLVEITSVSGYQIKVTQNHRMYIKRNDKKLIIKASEIDKTDKIATVGKLEIKDNLKFSIGNFVRENTTDIPELTINPDLCYFIGLMLGDGYSGCATIDNKLVYKGTPSIVSNDDEVLEHCQKVCKRLQIGFRRDKNSYGTSQLILGKNNWFREFLVRCGVEQKDKKYIAVNFMQMDLDHISSLLRGLFDSDGYVNKGRTIGFSNSSKTLVEQIQNLLLRYGIVSSRRIRRGGKMKIYGKEYNTLPSHELIIAQKLCIIKFYKKISFNIQRKWRDARQLVTQHLSNIHYISCANCNYKIYKDLFEGRSDSHKKWGEQKKKIIMLLGERGELGSQEIARHLGFQPRKNEIRLNHHYELIRKRKRGSISKTEWFWSLNEIGIWVYNHIDEHNDIDAFFTRKNCSICKESLTKVVKKGWRDSDFDGDIFWDKIRRINHVAPESSVVDLTLPKSPNNDHMFVANGFIVHNSSGINLPAKRVVISSVYRYSVEQGSYPIKTLEYKQMIGRAGRPQFDTEGEALLIAKKSDTVQWLMERYILNDSEAIYSKLSAMPALRRSILGLIASNITRDVSELFDFMEKTFYGFQYEAVFLEEKIREVLDLLIVWEMIDPLNVKETLNATKYGIRVSQLYLDPQTAASITEGLKIAVQKAKSRIHPVAIFDLLVGTPDMVTFSSAKKMQENTEKRFKKLSKHLLKSVPIEEDIEYDFRLRDFHSALFLWDWVNELPVERLVIRYKIGSGDIRRITDTATWLISAMSEIASIYSKLNSRFFSLSKNTELLSERVKYGIKSDAVSLTNIKGIGRKRARILLDHGIRKIDQLLVMSRNDLSKISGFGPELAKTILNEAKKTKSSEEDFEEITSSLDDHFN